MDRTAQARQVPTSAPELHIHLFGDFRVVYGDASAIHLGSPRLQALLAYLVLHRGTPQSRQHLAFQMWPDSNEGQARTNLRQLLHSLKQTLPEAGEYLYADAQTLQWQADAPYSLDVAEFEEAIGRAFAAEQQGDAYAARTELEHALSAYHGDLLPSCYDDWILPERERLREAFAEALDRLILFAESQGEPRAAIEYAQRLLRHDPLREGTYRALMRLHAFCGDRAAVMRVYNTCATVLQHELAAEPSPATREAYKKSLRVDAAEPPAKAQQLTGTNLPTPLTSFVGREEQVLEIARLLQTTRLLTLTGPGGCGKTRLALQTATNALDRYRDGVWWVELAGLSDAALVPQAVATALNAAEQPGKPLEQALVEYFRARQLLLLLDNCEHMVDTCAKLAEHWLSACPHLQILVTSREPLSIGGETTWAVQSMSLPADKPSPPIEEVSRSEAVRLFVERAAAVLPTFSLTETNSRPVAQICRRLDGIPLAIELAAARVKVLTVDQIAERLDDVFKLLTGGTRTALPRHQTLRAAINWSYDLLPAVARVLFHRLSVFMGGFTLEAAEAVCSGQGIGTDEVLALLSLLLDKSLVVMQERSQMARYRLLETIRQFAGAKLLEAGETERVRSRQLGYFLQLAERVERLLAGPEQARWLDSLEAERDNFRAALAWALEHQPEDGLRLAAALRWYWHRRGYTLEGRDWLARALERTEALTLDTQADPATRRLALSRGRALSALARIGLHTAEHEAACAAAAAAVEALEVVGDDRELAQALGTWGSTLLRAGDVAAARETLRRAEALARATGDPMSLSGVAITRAQIAMWIDHDLEAAWALTEENLQLGTRIGDPAIVARSALGLGWLAAAEGDWPAARGHFADSHRLFADIGDRLFANVAQSGLADAARRMDELPEAEAQYRAVIAFWHEIGQRPAVARCLECLAFMAAAEGRVERAGALFGAAEVLRENVGAAMAPDEQAEYAHELAGLRAHLSEQMAVFEAAWRVGRRMRYEEAVALAI